MKVGGTKLRRKIMDLPRFGNAPKNVGMAPVKVLFEISSVSVNEVGVIIE